LAEEIGENLNFMEVDFTPRKVKKTFKENYCTIGMASGFVEPLDAPGLSMTIQNIEMLRDLLLENTQLSREGLNQSSDQLFKK
jgi:hypothetical protein